jgi:hypothetical protein
MHNGVTLVIFTREARQKVCARMVYISILVWSSRHAVDGNESYQPEKYIVGDDVRRL